MQRSGDGRRELGSFLRIEVPLQPLLDFVNDVGGAESLPAFLA